MDLERSEPGRALKVQAGTVLREDAQAAFELLPRLLNKRTLSVLLTMEHHRLPQDQKEVLAFLAKHFVRGQNTDIQDPTLYSLMQSIDEERRLTDDDRLHPLILAAFSQDTGGHNNAEAQGGQSRPEHNAPQSDFELLTEPAAKKPRGRPRKHPKANLKVLGGSVSTAMSSESWGAVLRLESLELSPSFQNLNEQEEKILSVLVGNATASMSLEPQVLKNASGLEKDVDCCVQAKATENITALHKVRWLFYALLVGDIKNALFGDNKLTKTHTEEIQRILAGRYNQVGPYATSISLEMDINDVDRALTVGDDLAFLCDNLGTGCLFFLQDILTTTFITNRITRSGQAYEDAKVKLKELGLDEKIAKSGVGILGDSVRRQLREFYRVDNLELDIVMNEGRALGRIS